MATRRVRDDKTKKLTQPESRRGHRGKVLSVVLIFLFFSLLAALFESFYIPYIGAKGAGCVVRHIGLVDESLRWQIMLPYTGVLAIASILFGFIFTIIDAKSSKSKAKLFLFGILCILMLIVARVLSHLELMPIIRLWYLNVHLLPVVIFAVSFALAFPVSSAVAGILIGICLVSLPIHFIYGRGDFAITFVPLALASVVAALLGRYIDTRTRLMRMGVSAGLVHAVSLILLQFVSLQGELNPSSFDFWRMPVYAFANALVCAVFLTAFMPYIERVFGVTTPMRLKELADMNQPFMKKFLLEAPGTYHHSQIVSSLAEAGASAIGADPLLCRVGGYFHDIGKLNKPEYFTENEQMKGAKHSRLSPAMSALVIISHVKDGVAIAQELGLPRPVVEIIEQHHGTSVIEYFYREAVADAKRNGNLKKVHPDDFRYPGPKPKTKEAAIIMLVDAIEAAARSLKEPSSARIAELVHELTMKRLLDGQLDDSPLTLKEVRMVEESATRVLQGMFHTRVSYQKKEEETGGGRRE